MSDVELGGILNNKEIDGADGRLNIYDNTNVNYSKIRSLPPTALASADLNEKRKECEKTLKVLRIRANISSVLRSMSLFSVFCALTWASAVLLGSYVQALDRADYFEIPLLLFMEYVVLGLFAFRGSSAVKIIEVALTVNMGRMALTNYEFYKNGGDVGSPAPASQGHPKRQQYSLKLFYSLIVFNAVVVLLDRVIKVVLHFVYVRSSTTKSLLDYHDKVLIQSNSISWMHPWLDLELSFTLQSFDYKRGLSAEEVCKMYTDLVWYLYVHEGGFEAAEVAMAHTDGYVRQAAANMVGFWGVLETELQAVGLRRGCARLPLHFQIGLLSKLASVAAESYGPAGTAAARSIALLLEADPVRMATVLKDVPSQISCSTGKGLVSILLRRLNHLPRSSFEAHTHLQEEGRTYICALKKVVKALSDQLSLTTNMPEAQWEQILTEIQQSLPIQEVDPAILSRTGTGSIDDIIQRLESLPLILHANDEADFYFHRIKKLLLTPSTHSYNYKKLFFYYLGLLLAIYGLLTLVKFIRTRYDL